MTTASHYFLPGADGSPPMFGPRGFANGHRPSRLDGQILRRENNGNFCWCRGDIHIRDVDGESALALCIVAAMGWIRSKGWRVEIDTEGLLILFTQDEDGEVYREKVIHPISRQPDWLGAARWVYGQEKKTR